MHAAWTSPCAQRARPPARGAPRTSRPTSRRIPAPPPGRHGRMAATGAFVVGADVPGGPRPRRPASPERPRARSAGVPRARGMDVPMRAARRGRRALPAAYPGPPPGAARAHGGHGDICGRGRRPRRLASPERPRARMDVPVRAAWTSPCARRAEDVAPYQPAHPGPPPGRHGRMAVTGTFVVGADVPGGPRPRNVPVRAAWTSPCVQRGRSLRAARRGRRALPAAHPVPLCRETLRPPWALWP